MMNDPFLEATGVRTEASAMSNAISSALQRNKTYRDGCSDEKRGRFRTELARLIRSEAQRYGRPVSDVQHCEAIRRISDAVSQWCGDSLVNGRLRYGTAQKAFNLYLKFLWRLGKVATPPHCPVDSIVLAEGGIDGAWTKCDSEDQYCGWIDRLKMRAKPLGLPEWEYQVWLRGGVK
jgi:hypothetical protein